MAISTTQITFSSHAIAPTSLFFPFGSQPESIPSSFNAATAIELLLVSTLPLHRRHSTIPNQTRCFCSPDEKRRKKNVPLFFLHGHRVYPPRIHEGLRSYATLSREDLLATHAEIEE